MNVRIINKQTTYTAIVTKPARTVIANIAPYCLATGPVSQLTTRTRTRLPAPVTQTPSTAVPLAFMLSAIPSGYHLYNETILSLLKMARKLTVKSKKSDSSIKLTKK